MCATGSSSTWRPCERLRKARSRSPPAGAAGGGRVPVGSSCATALEVMGSRSWLRVSVQEAGRVATAVEDLHRHLGTLRGGLHEVAVSTVDGEDVVVRSARQRLTGARRTLGGHATAVWRALGARAVHPRFLQPDW